MSTMRNFFKRMTSSKPSGKKGIWARSISYLRKRLSRRVLTFGLFLFQKDRMVAGEVTPVAYDPSQLELTPTPTLDGSITLATNAACSATTTSGTSETTTADSPNSSGKSVEFYEGDLICLKVKDVLGITPVCGVHSFVYTPMATFAELMNDVAMRFQIVVGDFELVYQSKMDIYELTQMPPEETLSAANLLPSREKEYSITINGKRKGRKGRTGRGVARKLDDAFEACVTSQNGKDIQTDDSSSTNNGLEEEIIPKRDFVGLKNMNMTCYLNSLLQSLWFTPEFRNLIYVYIHNPERYKKRSICVPLQKLFLKLQFSVRESIETDELTNTFGWNNRDTWYQHDIEELCNLMMENLSEEFKVTPLEGMIEGLYFGAFNDYVKCLKCENRNMKQAAFLVVPLPIRQFGAPLANPTLEDALKSFTLPELLDGSNQYSCSRCQTACDAHKGLHFKKLPYILTIQLKRFEFDWNTLRKFKLNDRIVFPMVLDMNPYMDRSEENFNSSPDVKAELVNPSPRPDGTLPRSSHSRSSIIFEPSKTNVDKADGDGTNSIQIGWSRQLVAEKLEEVRKSSGPDVYQLFAVLVHRGGLTGGHYFAYILDFESHRWYRCDDSYVRKADIDDIEVSFGGDEEDKEPTSAYMLMYRRYDPEINAMPFLFDEMPAHIQELWQTMAETEKEAHEAEELEKNTIRMSVHYRIKGSWDITDAELNIPKGASTAEATLLMYRHFFPGDPEPPSDQVRLCRYDKDLGVIENSFEGNSEQYLTYTLRNPLPHTKSEGLILEIREQDERFLTYTPDDYVFVTQMIEYEKEDIRWVEEIHASSLETIAGLKAIIAEKLRIPYQNLIVALHASGQIAKPLDVDSAVLSNLGLRKINYIFVQSVAPEEVKNFFDFIDNYIHSIMFELEIQAPLSQDSSTFPLLGSDIVDENKCSTEKTEEGTEVVTKDTDVKKTETNEDVAVDAVKENFEPSGINGHLSNGISVSTLLEQNDVKEPLPTTKTSDLKTEAPTQSEELSADTVTNTPKPQHKFIMKIKDQKRSAESINCLARVDGRMPLKLFSEYLSKLIDISEKDFILYKIEKEEENEMLHMTGTFNTWSPLEKIRVRMGHRLQINEGRVAVYMLDMKVPFENCPLVGDVPLSLDISVDEAKLLVLTNCKDHLGGVDISNFRLRKRNQTTPSKVFRSGTKVGDFFNYSTIHGAEIYIQVLNTPEPITEKCYPILVRRWRPSELKLETPIEVVIFYDHSENIENIVLRKLQEITELPESDIEVAKPDSSCPYNMNPLAISDLTWFPLTVPSAKSLYVYNDELTLFVRDKAEQIKTLTPQEESSYRQDIEKNQGTYYGTPYALTPPRKEAGLKINLARSPPTP